MVSCLVHILYGSFCLYRRQKELSNDTSLSVVGQKCHCDARSIIATILRKRCRPASLVGSRLASACLGLPRLSLAMQGLRKTAWELQTEVCDQWHVCYLEPSVMVGDAKALL